MIKFLLAFLAFVLIPLMGETQILSTVAGNGSSGFSGDGGLAVNAALRNATDVCVDNNGNLYIADRNNFRIRKVNLASGIISTFAGNGSTGPALNGVNALSGSFTPWAVTLDKNNNLYITDEALAIVQKVDINTNIITKVAGSGIKLGPSGPGLHALNTSFWEPYQSSLDREGNIYIADYSYRRVRKVDAITGLTSDFAGNGTTTGDGDGGPANQASLKSPSATCVDPEGNLFIIDQSGYKIRRVDAKTGVITTFAGTGVYGIPGDGVPAATSRIGAPISITCDVAGNIYFAADNSTINKINVSSGIMTRVAGTGIQAFSPDGTPVLSANLNSVRGICIDKNGDLYFVEGGNRIRKIAAIAPAVCVASISIFPTSTIICQGQLTTFTAAAINSGNDPIFTWKKNKVQVATGVSYSASDLNDQDTIECSLTSNASCVLQRSVESNSVVISVTPVATPVISIATAQTEVCKTVNTVFTATVSNTGLNPSYQWLINQISTGNNSPVLSTVTLNDGDIVACIVSSSNSCATTNVALSNTITMVVRDPIMPSVTITSSAESVCEGGDIGFTALPAHGGTAPSYSWEVNGAVILNANTAAYNRNDLKDKDVVVCKMTSNAVCATISQVVSGPITVSVVSPPTVTIHAADTALCSGSPASFTASTAHGGNNPQYEWQVNGVTVSSANTFVNYKLKNSDKINCLLTASTVCSTAIKSNIIMVTVHPLPDLQLDSVVVALKGHPITLSPIVSQNVISYQWSPSSGLNNPASPFPSATPGSTIVYQLTILSSEGCTVSDNIKVIILENIDVPNVFSPNGDGVHDVWQIPGLSSYPGCSVLVFNRNGQVIYRSSGYDKPWDGLYNGTPVPVGAYYFIIDPKNGVNQFSGSVTIIR